MKYAIILINVCHFMFYVGSKFHRIMKFNRFILGNFQFSRFKKENKKNIVYKTIGQFVMLLGKRNFTKKVHHSWRKYFSQQFCVIVL